MRRYEACLKKCAEEVLDRRIARAVAQARAAGPARFAAVLLAHLPEGPDPGTVVLDADQLETSELLWVAGVDSTNWTPKQYREFVMQESA